MQMHHISDRRGNSRLIVVAAAFVVGAAVFWGVAFLLGDSGPPPDQGRDIAAAFLDDIRAGNVDAAWQGTTAEFKSFMGRERLVQFVRSQPVLKEAAEFVQFEMVSVQDLNRAQCTFRPESGSPSVKVLLAQENGDWKVERLLVE